MIVLTLGASGKLFADEKFHTFKSKVPVDPLLYVTGIYSSEPMRCPADARNGYKLDEPGVRASCGSAKSCVP